MATFDEASVKAPDADTSSSPSLESDIMSKDFVPFAHFVEGRNLEESVWEVSLFAFMPSPGLVSSVCTAAALLLAVVTQLTFSAVASVGFTNQRILTVDEAKLWRYDSAHDVTWTTPVIDASLASRVCAQDSSLALSTAQSNLVEDLELYLSSLMFIPQGGLLCVVACVIWFHLILAELMKAGNFMMGASALWLSSQRRGVMDMWVSGGCAFVSFCVIFVIFAERSESSVLSLRLGRNVFDLCPTATSLRSDGDGAAPQW